MDRPGIDFWVCLRFINNFVMQKYMGVFIILLLAGLNADAAKKPRKIDFVKEIQPIFEYNCVGCHREGLPRKRRGYQMDIKELAFKGRREEQLLSREIMKGAPFGNS